MYSDPFGLVTEPLNKLTLLTTTEFVSIYERKHLRDGKMSVKFLEEDLKQEFITFTIPIFSPFFEEFKDKIRRLIESGICPKMLGGKKPRVHYQAERTENEVPALVLNMEDLAIGFLVCLVPLALSVVAFICEVTAPRMKALAIKTRDLLTFLFLIRAVTKVRLSLS